jgi:hypothetical protein
MKEISDYEAILNKIKNYDFNSISETDIFKIICDFGLSFDNRGVYGKYELYMNKPGELGMWQRPDQLAPLIKYLLKECEISSFLEVGTYKASTFLILREFLYLKNKNLKSLTIDPVQSISNDFIKSFNINYQTAQIKDITDQYDLIFIDGDHSYDAVKFDFERALSLNPRYILFHDIDDKWCHGVINLWKEIRNTKIKYIEFKTNDEVMGLGLLHLK